MWCFRNCFIFGNANKVWECILKQIMFLQKKYWIRIGFTFSPLISCFKNSVIACRFMQNYRRTLHIILFWLTLTATQHTNTNSQCNKYHETGTSNPNDMLSYERFFISCRQQSYRGRRTPCHFPGWIFRGLSHSYRWRGCSSRWWWNNGSIKWIPISPARNMPLC